jgi:hypothetical protein
MFETCVPNEKVQWKETPLPFWMFILNAMIKNIKIQNIFPCHYSFKLCTTQKMYSPKNVMKILNQMFLMIF